MRSSFLPCSTQHAKTDTGVNDYDCASLLKPDTSQHLSAPQRESFLARKRAPLGGKAGKHQIWTLPKNRKNIATSMKRFGALGLALLLAGSAPAARAKSPLADAAEKLDRTGVRSLLKQRVDVNAPQVDGMTALHWAAYHDDLETAQLLTKAGASVKAANR